MKMKIFIPIFVLVAAMTTAFAGLNSYIRIDDPDDAEHRYLYNGENVNDVRYTFTGSVSSDCVSIRVIWSSGDDGNIDEYLENGSKKIRGVPIDDYVLAKFKAGDTHFSYTVSGSLDNLAPGSNFYRFIARYKDGRTKRANLSFYVYEGGAAERAKPVIYLYPSKTQTVKVSVAPKGGVTESIPEMGKGWKVTATPEGKITDSKTGKDYPYLFWESKDSNQPVDMSEGFVVKTEELKSFFTEKLVILGLNFKEIADFNEYWIPELRKSGKPYVFITFYSQDRIDAEAPLNVSPKPDSVIRVYFDHADLDAPIAVKKQILIPAERHGFAVVEWGGRRYK
ncbi:MAG: hypothetical protein IJU95_05425 [Treponema sp.]|nr:hypothetical protein [Treponema sp.]